MEVEKEIWRNISGYPGYQVSNKGNVKSLERNVKRKNGSICTIKEKILKPGKTSDNYLYVCLCKDNKRKNIFVHRLVGYAFVQNDSIFNTYINHKNEIKSDNRAENLEWCDNMYNNNYGSRNERISKSKSKSVKCLETDKIYPSVSEVQKQLGFSQCNLSRCCNGKRNTCGNYHWKWAD